MTTQPITATHIQPTMLMEHNYPNGIAHLCQVTRLDRTAWEIHMECGDKLPTEPSMTEYVALIATEGTPQYQPHEYCQVTH